MSPEIVALFDWADLPILIFAVVTIAFVGVALGMTIERSLSDKQRQAQRAWFAANRPRTWTAKPNLADAADQLRIVMGASFSMRPLLNKPEARLFKELDRMVIGCNSSWQVMAQVSLGEIIQSKDPDAHSCINSKRVDLLLVDGDCRPRHVVEYHGAGHHQSSAAARDAVKREALRKAGIGYHEIVAGQTTPAELRQLVEKLVDKAEGTALQRTASAA